MDGGNKDLDIALLGLEEFWHQPAMRQEGSLGRLLGLMCFSVSCLGLTLYPVFLHFLYFSDRLPQVISEFLPVLRIGSVEVY